MKVKLTDAQWRKILQFLQTCTHIYIGRERECRKFLEAVLWITRSGAQWRLLPKEYGNWNTVYKRFARWSGGGVFEKLFESCASDPDFENLILDSTVVRAHQAAAGAQKKAAGSRPRP